MRRRWLLAAPALLAEPPARALREVADATGRGLRDYFARGPRGLETGLRGSITTEILEFVGTENVAVGPPGGPGLAQVSMEDMLAWDPDWVITLDTGFRRHA